MILIHTDPIHTTSTFQWTAPCTILTCRAKTTNISN